MSKYSYSNILKSEAIRLKKSSNLKLSEAQEIIAKQHGFSDFHEFTTVAKRNPEDERLMRAALGVTNLAELIHTNNDRLYYELANSLSDLLASDIAETNAIGYEIDDYECADQTYDSETGNVTLDLKVSYSGEQEEDRAFFGSVFYVDLILSLKRIDGLWEYLPYDGIEVVKVVSNREIDAYNEQVSHQNISRRFDEFQEEKQDKELAIKLGISYDELSQLTWEFDTDESSDGLLYRYIMSIHDSAPQEILDKIDGLEDGRYVYFEPWEFETEEPDYH